MADKRIVLARNPKGNGIAIGPFKSLRSARAAQDTLSQMPGWRYDDTVLLISGADLKYMPVSQTGDTETKEN